MEADFIGKSALRKIRDAGVTRQQIGLVIDCPPLKGPNTTFWPIVKDGKTVGKVTSAIYSPRLKQNIALAMVSTECADTGMELEVMAASGSVAATVVEKPFYDPKKKITSAA
jgi:aminomethyltransferase